MRAPCPIHDRVADLLRYPAPELGVDLSAVVEEVTAAVPAAREHLTRLRTLLEQGAPGELEETFCRTFDNNADRALEVGWQLFGEAYERGAFLVTMRHHMRELDVEESAELPDHLSHALRVLGRLDDDRARQFVVSAVMPAVLKMLKGFDDDEHPYRGVVQTAFLLAESHMEVQLRGAPADGAVQLRDAPADGAVQLRDAPAEGAVQLRDAPADGAEVNDG